MSENKNLAPRLLVTTSPHIHVGLSAARVMWDVNLALLPALLVSLYIFGSRALVVILMSILGAVFAEFIIQKFLLKQPVSISDGSAILTGLLLAFCVPAALPWWIAFLGGFIAIAFGKQCYGGLGQNIFNPAHVARAILLASWPVYMTTWLKPKASCLIGCAAEKAKALCAFGPIPDGVTAATPLALLKATAKVATGTQDIATTVLTQYNLTFSDMFLGTIGGSLGETSKIALLLGGIYLLIRGHITWHTPVAMIGTVFAGALIFGGSLNYALFHLLAGGLFIGAIFMATDMVTSPMTTTGHLIFGFGCGAITLLIRMKGGYPEGVCYSILIMNAIVPLIDRFTIPRKFGELKEAKA